MEETKLNDSFALSEQEKSLIMYVRSLDFGEMNIMVREGKPIRIEKIKKSILLEK